MKISKLFFWVVVWFFTHEAISADSSAKEQGKPRKLTSSSRGSEQKLEQLIALNEQPYLEGFHDREKPQINRHILCRILQERMNSYNPQSKNGDEGENDIVIKMFYGKSCYGYFSRDLKRKDQVEVDDWIILFDKSVFTQHLKRTFYAYAVLSNAQKKKYLFWIIDFAWKKSSRLNKPQLDIIGSENAEYRSKLLAMFDTLPSTRLVELSTQERMPSLVKTNAKNTKYIGQNELSRLNDILHCTLLKDSEEAWDELPDNDDNQFFSPLPEGPLRSSTPSQEMPDEKSGADKEFIGSFTISVKPNGCIYTNVTNSKELDDYLATRNMMVSLVIETSPRAKGEAIAYLALKRKRVPTPSHSASTSTSTSTSTSPSTTPKRNFSAESFQIDND